MNRKSNPFSHVLQAEYVNPVLWEKIQQIDFNLIIDRMLLRHHWSQKRIELAITGYKQFLYMSKLFEQPISPTKDVDTIWHEHILHTNKYASDCEKTFGHFLHHFPTPAKWIHGEICDGGGGRCSTCNEEGRCGRQCDAQKTSNVTNFDNPQKEAHVVPVRFKDVKALFFRKNFSKN